MGRRRGNPVAGLASRQGELHPVMSAVAFAHRTEESGIGATMNVHTGAVAEPGKRGYIVGGQPDDRGVRIPTQDEPVAGGTNLDRIMGHRQRIRSQTATAPAASLGYWRDRESNASSYEVDASSIFHDRRKAVATGNARGEKAIWDLKKSDDIRLDSKRRQASA